MEYHIAQEIKAPDLTTVPVIGGKSKNCYDLISAFDIETTAIPDIEQSIMYIWQWIIGDTVYVGRTWEEFKQLIDDINKTAASTLVVYVHKLSYEISFLKGILDLKTEDIFVMKGRRVLKATYGHIEFRCSYMLTNLSLRALCEQCQPEHSKTEMEYTQIRFADTPLTPEELEYCVMDVVSLAECLAIVLKQNNDTLITVPLTATGYIRKEVRRIFRE